MPGSSKGCSKHGLCLCFWLNHIRSQEVLFRVAIKISRQHHTHQAHRTGLGTRAAAGGTGSLCRQAALDEPGRDTPHRRRRDCLGARSYVIIMNNPTDGVKMSDGSSVDRSSFRSATQTLGFLEITSIPSRPGPMSCLRSDSPVFSFLKYECVSKA